MSRLARESDLSYVVSLQRRFSNQLGFLPRVALAEYIRRGDVLLGVENGEPCGYLAVRDRVRSAPGWASIVQAAVPLDSQRMRVGLSLLQVYRRSLDPGLGLQLWCRVGLEAEAFWRAAGFVPVARHFPGSARGRMLQLWRLAPPGRDYPDVLLANLPGRGGHRGRRLGELTTRSCVELAWELSIRQPGQLLDAPCDLAHGAPAGDGGKCDDGR